MNTGLYDIFSRPVETLIIDASFLAHKHAHAIGSRLITSDGRPSGHIYGSFKQIRFLLSSLRPSRVAIAYDRGYEWRRALVPSYKAHRGAAVEGVPSISNEVETLLRFLPGVHLATPGSEADDMIAWFLTQPRRGAAAIYSGDHDLWQLVNDEAPPIFSLVSVKKGTKNNTFLASEAYVEHELGIAPKYVARWKAVTGDVSDGVPGLKGGARPGKKKALAAFIQSESADAYFAGDEEGEIEAPPYLAEVLRAEQPAVLANYAVVSLPEALKRLAAPCLTESKGNMPGMMDFLLQYECESLLGQVEQLFPKPKLFAT